MFSAGPFPSENECLVTSDKERDRYLLTIDNNSRIPDKTVYDFESLSGGRTRLVQGQPIQPLEGRLDVILSPKFLNKCFCVVMSQVSYQ